MFKLHQGTIPNNHFQVIMGNVCLQRANGVASSYGGSCGSAARTGVQLAKVDSKNVQT
jgi:hypothetical protein